VPFALPPLRKSQRVTFVWAHIASGTSRKTRKTPKILMDRFISPNLLGREV
jgi:hypothetical protein